MTSNELKAYRILLERFTDGEKLSLDEIALIFRFTRKAHDEKH